jgi:hypothetical protein
VSLLPITNGLRSTRWWPSLFSWSGYDPYILVFLCVLGDVCSSIFLCCVDFAILVNTAMNIFLHGPFSPGRIISPGLYWLFSVLCPSPHPYHGRLLKASTWDFLTPSAYVRKMEGQKSVLQEKFNLEGPQVVGWYPDPLKIMLRHVTQCPRGPHHTVLQLSSMEIGLTRYYQCLLAIIIYSLINNIL